MSRILVGILVICFMFVASMQFQAKAEHGHKKHYKKTTHYKWKRHFRNKWKRRLSCARNWNRSLQLIHSSDNESSFQDPNTLEEKILGYSAIVNGLQAIAKRDCIPSLHVTAGDHTIPGPFYQASSEVAEFGQPGLGDIAMYNAMKLKANGMGNHEFDGGIDEFAHMLNTAKYPFLAANLDFTKVVLADGTPKIRIGKDASKCGRNKGKVVKSCWLRVGGSKVGLIGRAPADFFNVIENPTVTIPGLDFVGGRDPQTNQPLVSALGQVLEQVEKLEQKGIKRIILLDHAQDFTGDPLQAQSLRGIDIIASAGSTGFFANQTANGPFNFLRPEDTRSETDPNYPVFQEDSEGNPVLVVNTEQLYRYVGHLIVTFTPKGIIKSVDTERSGPIATTTEAVDLLSEVIGYQESAEERVKDVLVSLQQTPTIQNAFTQVGTTTTALNGLRADVRGRETNLGRLAADSTLWFVQQSFPTLNVDVALKNGGGIRDTIQGPNIIRLTIQAALAFNNQLAILEMTGAQLLAAMENSVSRVPAADGRFPQIAGMTLRYDASQPGIQGLASLTTPSRVQDLVITRADGTVVTFIQNGAVTDPAILSQTFVLATNSFLATGGDGYAAFSAANSLQTTAIGEQQILEDYITQSLGGTVNLQDPPANPRVVRTDTSGS